MTESLTEGEEPSLEIDPTKEYLQELVGDGKKFKSTEDLARGKYESDSYIKILERRLDEMRDDYKKVRSEADTAKRLDDLINQLSRSPSETPPAKEERQPAFDSKQLESLVSSKIQEHETSRQQMQNFKMVEDRLIDRYGAGYKARLKEQIAGLGITETELNDMARRQPKLLLKTLEVDRDRPTESFQSPPSSVARQSNFSPTGQKDRTWTYYQQLKKEKPDAWFDRKIAVQMHEDAQRLGDKFYDGNFYVKGLHEQ